MVNEINFVALLAIKKLFESKNFFLIIMKFTAKIFVEFRL